MRRLLAGIFLLFLLASGVHAGTFEQLESDPYFVRVKNACIVGDPVLSLLRLQKEFIDVSATGAKEGLIDALGFKNPTKIDPSAEARWDGTPFGLGLLDCFGNDDRGQLLMRAFLTELILGYSASQSLSWGAATFTTLKAYAFAGRLLAVGLKSAASEMGWLSELLENNPELLPRLRTSLKWLVGAGIAAKTASVADDEYRADVKAEDRQASENLTQKVISSDSTADESHFEAARQKEMISVLKARLKTCSSQQACQSIQSALAAIERDQQSD